MEERKKDLIEEVSQNNAHMKAFIDILKNMLSDARPGLFVPFSFFLFWGWHPQKPLLLRVPRDLFRFE